MADRYTQIWVCDCCGKEGRVTYDESCGIITIAKLIEKDHSVVAPDCTDHGSISVPYLPFKEVKGEDHVKRAVE